MTPQRAAIKQLQVVFEGKERGLCLQTRYDKASCLRHATWKSKVNAKLGKPSSAHPKRALRQPVATQLCCVVLPQVCKAATYAFLNPSAHVLPVAIGIQALKMVKVDRKPPRPCGAYTEVNVNGDVRVLGGACSFGLALCKSSGVITSSQEVQSLLTVPSLLAGQLLLVCVCSSCALPH